MSICKSNYTGIFNYSHEIIKLYAYAYSKDQAREIMLQRLAKQHDVSVFTVRGRFPKGADNHEIRLEIEWREEEGEG